MFAALDSLSDRHCIDTTNAGCLVTNREGNPSRKQEVPRESSHLLSWTKLVFRSSLGKLWGVYVQLM